MPNTNLPIQNHDCKEYAEVIASHERRINDFSEWKSQISSELSSIRATQLSTTETMKETRQEIVGQQKQIITTLQAMQIENATLAERIRAESEHKKESKSDNKWLANLALSIPQLLITLAAIFAAIKFIPK